MKGKVPLTYLLLGNGKRASRESLRNASVWDHWRSDVIYSISHSKQNQWYLSYSWQISLEVILRTAMGREKKILPSSLQQPFIFSKILPWFAKTLIILSAPKWVAHLSCGLVPKTPQRSGLSRTDRLCPVSGRVSHIFKSSSQPLQIVAVCLVNSYVVSFVPSLS